MVDNHSYSFFGQKVGLIIQSVSKKEPFIYFRLIKSKNDGSWERPSSGEGKIIKFSLEELIWILRVLNKDINSWSSYHTFKDNKTSISFKWEDGEKTKLWIHIGSYSKVLDYAQFKMLELLLAHILEEKVEFATTPNNLKRRNVDRLSNIVVQEEIITDDYKKANGNNNPLPSNNNNPNEIEDVGGTIKGETEKALLIQFENKVEAWIPKSRIHSGFNNTKNLIQKFRIDSWILKNNKVLS